jgi:hypothetical protein
LSHSYLVDFKGELTEPDCENGLFDFDYEKKGARDDDGEMDELEVREHMLMEVHIYSEMYAEYLLTLSH